MVMGRGKTGMTLYCNLVRLLGEEAAPRGSSGVARYEQTGFGEDLHLEGHS